jgi:hypothetical protein|tara:strand:+ start:274 stop:1503 length:1230 start_codon:yes stop_codon:yes gene_type:complete
VESFKGSLQEAKNTHMMHIEDKVLYGGVEGTREAINALRELRNMLQGKHKQDISVKWDGAPAIFAGTDPSDGQFFVAKKGVFNKNPKVYKTKADVDADTSGDLNKKMNAALEELPALGIKGIIQGDFLFGPGDVSSKSIGGEKYLTFHPNTIVYAFPVKSQGAKEVKKSRIGIVWHTTYSGSSFESLTASYGVDVKKLKKTTKVWSQDAMLRDVSVATMTEKETKQVDAYLSEAGKLFSKISGSTLRQLEANQELAQLIEQFNNTFVRKGEIIKNSKRHTLALQNWLRTKYKKEEDKRSSDKGKKAQQKKLADIMTFFSKQNTMSLVNMFELQKQIVLAKIILINKLNDLANIDTFVKTSKGYKVTGQEGFVAIDKLGGDAVKLVDRMEFSYNNFSPNILKGWDSKGGK